MNHQEFSAILHRRLELAKKVLGAKAEEYATDTDRLHNFKAAAQMDGETPERALKGMWKKQLVSIFDIINNLDRNILPTSELIDEKVGDAINYLILLEGLLYERICKSKGPIPKESLVSSCTLEPGTLVDSEKWEKAKMLMDAMV